MTSATVLVIFDKSGSMDGSRYQACHSYCRDIPAPFRLWLFDTDVADRGLVKKMPEFACDGGTSIKVMLDKLHSWMQGCRGAYVCVITDGDDTYDESHYTKLFHPLKKQGHHVTVVDLCHTNVDPLKHIFAGFSISIAGSQHEADKLMKGLSDLIAHDNKIAGNVQAIIIHINSLKSNVDTLLDRANQLANITKRLDVHSKFVFNEAEEARRTQLRMREVETALCAHFERLATHLGDIQENIIEAEEKQIAIKKVKLKINTNPGLLRNEKEGAQNEGRMEMLQAELDANKQKLKLLEGDLARIKARGEAEADTVSELIEKTAQYRSDIHGRRVAK